MKTCLFLTLTTIILSTLTACGTIRGVGQDVSAAGRGVSNAATAVQKSM